MSRSPFFRPAVAGDPFWDMWNSERFFDSHFGSNLTEEDFFPTQMVPSYFFTRRHTMGAPRSPLIPHSPMVAQQQQIHPLATVPANAPAGSVVAGNANNNFLIFVDVSHFTPEEVSVKTVDNTVVVVAKHEDKADNYGYVSRQFSRKYLLPADIDPETVTSTLSADGILNIQAPRKPLQINETDGRSVPISISNVMLSPVRNLTAPQFPTAPVGTNIPVSAEPSAAVPVAPAQAPVAVPVTQTPEAAPTTQQ